jgi:hypothetical protein
VLGKHRCRQEDNIRMVLKEVEFEDVDCIQQVQCRVNWRAVVIRVMNLFGFMKGRQ